MPIALGAAPFQVAALLGEFTQPWAIAGGWAIDLYLDRSTRAHKDVDVAVYRPDQALMQRYLTARGWLLEVAHEGIRRPWLPGEDLALPLHGIWCHNPAHDPDFVEMLLNETTTEDFCFRRNPAITLPCTEAFVQSAGGLPILAPELVLLYKGNQLDQPENRDDFAAAVAYLAPARRSWLQQALVTAYPDGAHPLWELCG